MKESIKRNAERIRKNYPVFCRSSDETGVGETIDVSEKGLKMAVNAEFKAGDPVSMAIIPETEVFTIHMDGIVMWAKKSQDSSLISS